MEQIVTVKKLKQLYNSGKKIQIDTPDGWKDITNWYDKGILPIIKINTKNYTTECAVNHLIEVERDKKYYWLLANELSIGDKILTLTGIEEIESIENLDPQECYDFTIDSDNHRYWGDGISSHNSGKSLISSYCMSDALKQGISVHYIDTEDATTTDWIERIGVDVNDPNFIRIQTNSMKNILKYVSEVCRSYEEAMEGVPEEEQPGLLFVLDSLSGMFSEEEEERMSDASFTLTDGMRKAIVNAKFINTILNLTASKKIGMVMTNHVSTSMDQYSDDNISGGKKVIFLSSIVVQINKNKLKEDEYGNKLKDEVGITSSIKVQKTRFTKPFERVYITIPYDKGMNPYSGLFELFDKKGFLVKDGMKYHYNSLVTGEELFFCKRKEYDAEKYDIMMKDFMQAEAMGKLDKVVEEISEENNDETE